MLGVTPRLAFFWSLILLLIFNENWEEAGGDYEALSLIFDSVCSVRKLKSLTAAGLVSVGGEAGTELVQAECSCNVTSVTQLTLSDPQHVGPAFDNCKLDLVLEDNRNNGYCDRCRQACSVSPEKTVPVIRNISESGKNQTNEA
ncbi:hypothetical protein EV360DRAFT_71727 [Lentinula raphanica]|nr:hypothetical protein EV360DRAFT_71727 [Lentinula raphanica]